MNVTTPPLPGPHLFCAPGIASVVDCKPDRPLTGDGTVPLNKVMDADFVQYAAMPFLDALNALVGVHWRLDLPGHLAARDTLFRRLPVTKVGLRQRLVVTQERVNVARVEQLVTSPGCGARKPVAMVLHEGRHYVVNGHHRLVARWRSGLMDMDANVMHLIA